MNFIEIVEAIDLVEQKLDGLTTEKLGLVTSIITEGTTEFDTVHHLDYIVEYVETLTDANAEIIRESVDCDRILSIILENVQKHPTDNKVFLSETIEQVEDIELDVEEDIIVESETVTLLSVVSNTLTEILGESTVEALPAGMIFDIVESTKELEMGDEADELTVVDLITVISEKLKEALEDGTIDFDSDDYEGETLSEFLDDYEDLEDLLSEMEEVSEEVLAESTDTEAAKLLLQAKSATQLIEGVSTVEPLMIEAKREKAKKSKAANEKKSLMETRKVDVPSETKNVENAKRELLKSVMKQKIYQMAQIHTNG